MKRVFFCSLGKISVVLTLSLFLACGTGDKVTGPSQSNPLSAIKQKVINAAKAIQLQVQAFRGKNYKRQVFISVFTQSQYATIVGNQTDSIPESQKVLYDQILRIEGLLRPNADYFASYDSTMSTETEGFYVPGTDSLYIILNDTATGLTFDDSVTIFHEFVHALQDQYFNLKEISYNTQPSDVFFARRYVIEGEAELLENYYAYKLSLGVYPSSPTPIMNQLNQDQIWADALLDSMHQAGEPLLANMPFLWEYYSYGPKFINAIAGMNWSIIDNTIFSALPLRMLEILHPSEYSPNNEYFLNTESLDSTISIELSDSIEEEDQQGELLTDVIFREWNFDAYATISDGIMVDDVIVFKDLQTDSLRMIWYTYWQDSSAGSTFFTNYANLVNKKRNILLPAAVDSPTYVFINDTMDNIYIEQAGNYVFTLENCAKSELNGFIGQCRLLKPQLYGALAKARVPANKRYPHVNKHRFWDGKFNPPIRAKGFAGR
jgi:hypothetical protein